MAFANNKDADQPGHSCSLICTFVGRYLDTSTYYIRNFKTLVVSLAEQASLVKNPEGRFSRDESRLMSS